MMLTVMVAPLMTSCTNLIYDEEGDCEVTYQLQFIYDKNMKFADAFAHEVKSVRVYVFDENDQLVWTATESGEHLSSGEYRMKLSLLPGNYHLLAWCGADNNPGDEHFTIASGSSKVTTFEEVKCYLNRTNTGENAVSDKCLHALYHGEESLELADYSAQGGTYTYPVYLTKDTNTIRIVLQQLSGNDLDENDFEFTITDQNGYMAADNSLLPDETITYCPWAQYSGYAGIEESNPRSRVITDVKAAIAELTVARLMADRHRDMILTVSSKTDGHTIIRIPVIDYCLLVKGYEHNNLSDQDYLDRQDEYSMVFFIDENHEWLASSVLINSWRVVFQQGIIE